jgi:hypothetical protein
VVFPTTFCLQGGKVGFGHHLDQVPGAEFERQVPPDAKGDYSLVKMPTLEEILRPSRFCPSSRYRRGPSLVHLVVSRP